MNDIQEPRHQPNPTRIRIQIPAKYHQQPIISELASRHGVKVNIVAAILGANAQGDGWFDLELNGSPQQINSALIYLAELNVRVWNKAVAEPDVW